MQKTCSPLKVRPLPLPLSQAWERGARQGGVRDLCCDYYRHKNCMNEKPRNSIKVNSLYSNPISFVIISDDEKPGCFKKPGL